MVNVHESVSDINRDQQSQNIMTNAQEIVDHINTNSGEDVPEL